MKLVAEAGSTKIQWGIISSEGVMEFETSGFNPNISDRNYLRQLLVSGFPHGVNPNDFTHIIYYGTGCSAEKNKAEVKRALKNFFVNSQIQIYTDLEAAGVAIFNSGKGFIGILGTGSSFGYFENYRMVQQSPSLGYLLGDEGGGAHIGRMFLNKLLTDQLPSELKNEIMMKVEKTEQQIIKELYSSKTPNAHIASYMPMVKLFLSEKPISDIINNSFQQFIDISVKPLSEIYGKQQIGLVGGVAANFSTIINELFTKNQLPTPIILNRSFDNVIDVIP